ncbi:NETI motif-containing protein [Terrilactibacillus sp. S3-3]|nr:NETI motif-containing protein [Terrilactibacillus sp. S3-3]
MSKRDNKNNHRSKSAANGLKPGKKRFIVDIGESLEECLEQMKKEGYEPIARIEKPVFKEGDHGPEYAGQYRIIEGKFKKEKGEH